jgi:DNA polymerase-3 subunit delta'
MQSNLAADMAQQWQAFPESMLRGDVSALADWPPATAVDALQKLCHDLWAVRMGAAPRFFTLHDLASVIENTAGRSPKIQTEVGANAVGVEALASWSRDLNAIARTVDHPYNPSLLIESLVSRARTALTAR